MSFCSSFGLRLPITTSSLVRVMKAKDKVSRYEYSKHLAGDRLVYIQAPYPSSSPLNYAINPIQPGGGGLYDPSLWGGLYDPSL